METIDFQYYMESKRGFILYNPNVYSVHSAFIQDVYETSTDMIDAKIFSSKEDADNFRMKLFDNANEHPEFEIIEVDFSINAVGVAR